MHYFILLILLGMPMITPLVHGIIQNNNTGMENIMYDNDTKNVMQDESSYTVEGTITKVTFTNLSKTIRVQRLAMRLYLTTPDSPHEELKFTKRPVAESDKKLRVGQRVSITARENEYSEYAHILHIEPL